LLLLLLLVVVVVVAMAVFLVVAAAAAAVIAGILFLFLEDLKYIFYALKHCFMHNLYGYFSNLSFYRISYLYLH
jgi:hypothetical protein